MSRPESEPRHLWTDSEAFRFFVENVTDYAIFMLDPTGTVVSWNAGAERFKGYTAEEIIGRHFSAFYPPEDVEAGKPGRLLDRAVREGHSEDEGWRVRKDGSRFWADVIITALVDDRGELLGFGKITRDLTERHAVEEARVRFIANAAHELRTPLTTIAGFAEALEHRTTMTEDEIAMCVGALRRGSERMLALVTNLLDLTRLDQGRIELAPEPLDVDDMLRRVLETAPPPPGTEVEVTPAPAACVWGDAVRTEQILLNLLTNAYRYGRGNVRIDVARDHAWVSIRVRDDGEGVPTEFTRLMFEPFTRGVSRTAAAGSGLGLAISRTLAVAMGGTLDYRRENDFTTFALTMASA